MQTSNIETDQTGDDYLPVDPLDMAIENLAHKTHENVTHTATLAADSWGSITEFTLNKDNGHKHRIKFEFNRAWACVELNAGEDADRRLVSREWGFGDGVLRRRMTYHEARELLHDLRREVTSFTPCISDAETCAQLIWNTALFEEKFHARLIADEEAAIETEKTAAISQRATERYMFG